MRAKEKGGFTLVETLVCVGIVALLAVGAGTLLNGSSHIYRSSVFESDSTTLSGTLNTALSDLLCCADLSPAQPSGNGIYIENAGKQAYTFSSTSLNYPLSRAHFALSGNGILQAVSGSGDIYEVVNTGAYPNLKVTGFSCNYDGGSFLKISYSITGKNGGTGTREVKDYTVRLLNRDSCDSATAEAEKLIRDTNTYLAGNSFPYLSNASLYSVWQAKKITADYIRSADMASVLKSSDIAGIANACARKYGLTDADRANVVRGLQRLPGNYPYLAPYYCQGSREVIAYFINQGGRDALCSTSCHASTCLLRYEKQWYFYYGNFNYYSKTLDPDYVLAGLYHKSSGQIQQFLNGDGWYVIS